MAHTKFPTMAKLLGDNRENATAIDLRLIGSCAVAALLCTALLYPSSPAKDPNDKAQAMQAYERGLRLSHTSNYREALDCFQIAIGLDPNFQLAYRRAAEAEYYLDHHEKAMKLLNKAIALDATDPEIFIFRSKLNGVMANSKGRKSDMDKAIELSPKNAYYYDLRGDMYTAFGDTNAGIKDYTTSITFLPLCKRKYLDAMVYKDRGNLYRKAGRYEEAIRDYTFVIEHCKSNVLGRILHDRADCYDKIGKHALAEKDRAQLKNFSQGYLDDLMK